MDTDVKLVLDRFMDADGARKPREAEWARAYNLYRGIKPQLTKEQSEAGLANLFIPKAYSDVESLVPRVIMPLIGQRPWIQMKPMAKDDVNRAKMVSKLLQSQFDKQSMFIKLADFIKQGLIYGTSVMQTGWKYDARRQVVRKYDDRSFLGVNLSKILGLKPVASISEQMVNLWDDPWAELIDIADFFPDPESTNIDEMVYIIRREFTNIETMEAMEIYDSLPEVKGTTSAERSPSIERQQNAGLSGGTSEGSRTKPIELIHCWMDGQVITLANRQVIVRNAKDNEYPYDHGKKPFLAMVDNKIPNEFWGLGTVTTIADLQEELNTLRNQRRDNVSLRVHQMFMASKNAGINPAELVWRSGGVIWVDDLIDINKVLKPIEVPDISRAAYEEEAQIQRDIEQTNGVSDFARGQQTQNDRTATEIQQMSMGINARVELKVRLIAEMALKSLGVQFHELNKQFITDTRVIRLLGTDYQDEWITVEPGDLQVPYDDLVPQAVNIETESSRMQTREDLLRLIQIVGRAPEFAQMLNMRAILQAVLETYHFADVEQFLIDPAQAQQMQMMQALAGRQGQPGSPVPSSPQGGMPGGAPGMPSGAGGPDIMGMLQQIMGGMPGGAGGGPTAVPGGEASPGVPQEN